jgi:lipopolysaccharide transport system ATP-binding protein
VGKEGRTILFVSHNMNAIHRLCQRVILLDDGKVSADGDTSDVIAQYLNADRSAADLKEWISTEQAPGDDTVRLKRVRLFGRNGENRSTFEIREPVYIEVEFWGLDPRQPFMPILVLHNDNGICVLETAANHDPVYTGKTRTKGIYRSVCSIPGNFFNEGMYNVDVLIRVLVPRRYFVRESNLLSFRVEDSGSGKSVKGDFHKNWSGVVAPLLPWKTTIRPLSAGEAPIRRSRKKAGGGRG